MKERPILFNGEMVRAILEGRKTQSRRPCKFEADKVYWYKGETVPKGTYEGFVREAGAPFSLPIKSPFGKAGDRLWVRETFNIGWCEKIIFKADCKGTAKDVGYEREPIWTPSIHMPRNASRITLEVTNVRVERLQDISEDDARKEGAKGVFLGHNDPEGDDYTYRAAFKDLWNSVYKNWHANPWVWVIDFAAVKS